MAVIVIIKVAWTETNRPHTLALSLLTADGQHAVMVPGPVGEIPLQVQGEFEVGRPPGLPEGSAIDHSLAVNMSRLPLEPGRYEWRLKIDDNEEDSWRAAFVVSPSKSAAPPS